MAAKNRLTKDTVAHPSPRRVGAFSRYNGQPNLHAMVATWPFVVVAAYRGNPRSSAINTRMRTSGDVRRSADPLAAKPK
jgi:hypothetical protein